MGFWDAVGSGLAAVGKASLKGALWASKNPNTIAGVATLAGHPEVAAAIKAADIAVDKIREARAEDGPTEPVQKKKKRKK